MIGFQLKEALPNWEHHKYESEDSIWHCRKKNYTVEDIYALPNGQRAELIDGQMYMMAPPSTEHQRIVFSLSRKIADYIDSKGGSCEVFPAPFAAHHSLSL